MTELLQIRGLAIRRNKAVIVRVERLDVEHRKTLAIVGPNGAGKSTLLLGIAGLLRIESGSIRYLGKLISKVSCESRARLGIRLVAQFPMFPNELTFSECLQICGVNTSMLDSVPSPLRSRFMGLIGDPCRRAGSSTIAEKKLFALGLQLMSGPSLLLLDEPGAGLGKSDLEILRTTITHASGYLSIVVVEHRHDLITDITSRVIDISKLES